MIIIVIGTRPELIKIFPLVGELKKKKINFKIIHTGQHYSSSLNNIFLKYFKSLKISYNLKIGSHPASKQTALMMTSLEAIFNKINPKLVIVYGDTNTALAGALVASKNKNIKLLHLEAGLRSFQKKMPEETNRKIIDHISDYLFPPTKLAKKLLIKENISKSQIFLIGNTIKDSIKILETKIKEKNILTKMRLKSFNYFLVTIHREENLDTKERLNKILHLLSSITKKYNKCIIFPCHPRTRNLIKKFKLKVDSSIKIIEPLRYDYFLNLLYYSFLVISDSGGIQEESCILKKKMITLRTKTERQETIKIGCNVLSTINTRDVFGNIDSIKSKKIQWSNPYGQGNISQKIANQIKKLIKKND